MKIYYLILGFVLVLNPELSGNVCDDGRHSERNCTKCISGDTCISVFFSCLALHCQNKVYLYLRKMYI